MRTNFLKCIVTIAAAAGFLSCGGGGNSGGGNNGGGGPPPPALTITTGQTLPPTIQGHAYSTTLAAANGQGALHWSIAPLASNALFVTGLAIDPNTGIISGTANFTGTGGFNATVTDSASSPRSATLSFSITAYQPLTDAAIQTASVMEFQTPFVQAGIQGGVPPISYRVTSGTMPPGLRFNTGGQLAGAAYALGTYQFTVTAQDSFSPPETANQPFTITITPPPITVTNSLPSQAALNRPFSARVVAVGGVPPYKFSLAASTSLPPGLSLDSGTGIISGTPTSAGSDVFSIQATDSQSPVQNGFGGFQLTVAQPLGRNDSPATATAIDNGSINASISPYIDPPNGVPTAGDNDYYKLTSLGGATVHIETSAKRTNPNNPLDTVIEIVDGNGLRLSTCRQPGDTSTTFASSCINDDISASPHIQDSALDFQVPGAATAATTFYVHVLDWRGDARPDMTYSLTVSGLAH